MTSRALFPFLLFAALGCAAAQPVPGPEPAPAPATGSAAAAVTEEAAADAANCTDEPAGRDVSRLGAEDVDATVVVEGEARLGPPFCTRMACEIPCCNRCGAPLLLGGDETGRGGLLLAGENAASPKCGGTDCKITCTGLQPGQRYRVSGTLRAGGLNGGFSLDVGSVCKRVSE